MERMKRVVSLMLCIVMVFGLLPMTVFATDVDTTDEVFEEYFEEEVAVEAPVVGNENPVDPETIIFEEEIEYVEEAPVIENEEPVAPVTTEESETVEAEEEIEFVEEAEDMGDANPVAPVADDTITKTVYMKVDTVTSGKQYLIVSSNSGSGYALGSSASAANAVTITENTLGTYIENKGNALEWTATASGNYFTFASGSYKLGYSNRSLSLSTGSNWTYSNNQLVYQSGSTTRYLTYSNNTWRASSSRSNVYLYEKTTVEISVTGYGVEITKDGNVVAGTISQKRVTSATTMELGAQITVKMSDGSSNAVTEGAQVQWTVSDETIATIDQNGVVTFKGVDGQVNVTVTVTMENGMTATDVVTINAFTTAYSEGSTDFPEYPNEGAIRHDKTASAVGNFSETGIAKMELSMTGVPYTAGSEIDVVIMLDRSTSMTDTRISATQAATKAFLNSIVKNTDGTFNGNRVYVGYFMGTSVYNLTTDANGLVTLDAAKLSTLESQITSVYTKQTSNRGTDYVVSLQKCKTLLENAKKDGIGNNRQQFVVFMSDGEPYNYTVVDAQGNTSTLGSISNLFTTSGNTSIRSSSNYKYEYYSTEMKGDNVTVYSVGLGLSAKSAEMVLNDISGPAGETQDTQPDKKGTSTQSKLNKYFFSVADANAAADMKKVFSGIAQSIMQAATNVTVEDQITPEYTMIFDIPTGTNNISEAVGSQEFYIEFLKYTLDEQNDRTSEYTSMAKLYLGKSGNSVYAASDAAGTAYAAPVFEQKPIGDKGSLYYWTTDASKGDTGVSVTVGGTTYYFVSYGLDSGYNMTSGAYAAGTVNATNTSTDLILATPYFVYNANTKMLYWTVDKLDSYEYVLNYFLYLDNSATEVGYEKEIPATSYYTNHHAYVTYTNFNDNDCRQEFRKPNMTWNGAQASYVFYLVNEQGQPINNAGVVIDFANAIFVTDVFTESITWNKENGGDVELDIAELAKSKLPEGYVMYDEKAEYDIRIFENSAGQIVDSWFKIGGDNSDKIANKETTKVYNTKGGVRYDDYGTYYSNDAAMKDFDFANTTAAFAVVWGAELRADTVVVDFGLDVLINVTANDNVKNNTINNIGWTHQYGDVEMNKEIATASKIANGELTQNGKTISIENDNEIRFSQGSMIFNEPATFYYDSAVQYIGEDGEETTGYMYSSVTVIPATTIYYEDSFVTLESYTWDSTKNEETGKEKGWTKVEGSGVWSQVGETITATQAQDRPGNLSAALDANNIYGYDQAYDTCSEYSLGSAMKATVNDNNYGAASFTFHGTGFDVVSLTSGETGTILVDIMDDKGNQVMDANGKPMSYAVDTYYGYKYTDCLVTYTYDKYANNEQGAWILTSIVEDPDTNVNNSVAKPANPNHGDTYVVEREDYIVDPNAEDTLYQVPVIKSEALPYGQYTVTIRAVYDPGFDHKKPSEGKYEFYLDAIRIYDPTGNLNDTANDAYEKDGERAPSYQEIRNNLIEAKSFDIANSEKVNGVMFIDGRDQISIADLTDYANYGPNNEVYLKEGQSIAFMIDAPDKANLQLKNVHFGAKSADGSEVTYSVANIYNDEFEDKKTFTLKTSTDMYYDLTEWVGEAQVIVITNESESVLSLTNLKYTYGERDSQIFARTTEVVEEVVEAYAYMTAADAEMVLRALNADVEDETEPEVTEPETEATEPETEPETTKPGSNTGSVVKKIIGIIGKLLGKIFG